MSDKANKIGVDFHGNNELQHTLGHLNCPACEEMRAKLLRSISAVSTFSEAALHYLSLRSIPSMPGAVSARYIRENTEADYRRKLRAVSLFFGDSRLCDIHWYNMRAYQATRLAGDEPFIRKRQPHLKEAGRCPAKAKQVNQEMGLLKQIKVKSGCWTPEDEAYFEFLQEEETDVQRALDPSQQQLWLDAARSNPRWDVVLHWSIVSFDSLMSTNELRGLQLGHINLSHQLIRVPWASSKNRFRHREIAIEDPTALWSLDRLLARAHDLGAIDPQHYLFPFKVTRSKLSFPGRQMTESGIKKPWQEVREATGLTWFRPYDCRHTGATRFAEEGKPTEMIVARMGHCSDKMRRHYTHISVQAQRMWFKKQPEGVRYPTYKPVENNFLKRY